MQVGQFYFTRGIVTVLIVIYAIVSYHGYPGDYWQGFTIWEIVPSWATVVLNTPVNASARMPDFLACRGYLTGGQQVAGETD